MLPTSLEAATERMMKPDSIAREVLGNDFPYVINQLMELDVVFTDVLLDTAGSASMLPRELNGVVDPKLKVYGTANIRVVDLSIVPLHFAAHSQGANLKQWIFGVCCC